MKSIDEECLKELRSLSITDTKIKTPTEARLYVALLRMAYSEIEEYIEDTVLHYKNKHIVRPYINCWETKDHSMEKRAFSYIALIRSTFDALAKEDKSCDTLKEDFIRFEEIQSERDHYIERQLLFNLNRYKAWCTGESEAFSKNMTLYVTLRETNSYTVEIVDILDIFTGKLAVELRLLTGVITNCRRDTDEKTKEYHGELWEKCNTARAAYISERTEVLNKIATISCEEHMKILENKVSKCLLTEESIRAILHDTRNEYWYIIALCKAVHYPALSVLSRLCKAGYTAVYRAMKQRLMDDGGIFHPSLMKEWCWARNAMDAPEEAELAHIADHSRKQKTCVIIATKELNHQVNEDCLSNYKKLFNLHTPCMSYLHRQKISMQYGCTHMTGPNKRALTAFGLNRVYLDTLYALQTCYPHLYFEFIGECHEKSSELFKRSTENISSILFKLDDEEGCFYRLSFVVKDMKRA